MNIRRVALVVGLALAGCGPVHFGHDSIAGAVETGPGRTVVSGPASARPALAQDTAGIDLSGPADDPTFSCLRGAITCIRVYPPRDRAADAVPVTFGHPFAPGDLPRGAGLVAREANGTSVPVQIDEPASGADGSVHFAVLSMLVPHVPAGGAVLSLFAAPGAGDAAGPPLPVSAALQGGHDVTVALTLHSAQITKITLGNRRGTAAGIPFNAGETVTAKLGDDPADRYTVTVNDYDQGGDFGHLTRLAQALCDAINKGTHFKAYKVGEGGGFENLWVTTADSAKEAAFDVQMETTSKAQIKTEIIQPYEAPKRYTASTRTLLQSGTPGTWLSGPIATEYSVTAPFVADDGTPHPRLTARFNVRVYKGVPEVRTDAVVEDIWTYQPDPHNWHYDARITVDGKPVFSVTNLTQYHHARWHHVVWSGAEPDGYVQYNKHYILNSRAVPHYDEALKIPYAVVAGEKAELARANTGPMGNAFVTYYFGTTGGRADIGPLPRWTVIYLLTMDPEAYTVMMANADASGHVPIHFRDRKTGRPVKLDDHPGTVLSGWPPSDGDPLPKMTNSESPWSPDTAHQASLVYVPYMVTGDEYYLEEVQFWATWDMGVEGPGVRRHADGLVINSEQVRAHAWSMRALTDAAWISPDRDPMKAYYTQKLENNIAYALSRHAKSTNPLALDAVSGTADHFAPWQLNFLITTIGQTVARGYGNALGWEQWLGQLSVGMWNNEANGYCRVDGAAGWLYRTPKGGGPLFTTWQQVAAANYPNQTTCPTSFPKEAYDGSSLGYVVNAMAAMAVLSDIDYPKARETYDFILDRESRVNFARDPTWKLTPR